MSPFRSIFIIVITSISTAGIFGQTELKSLDDIAAYGAKNNLDYRSSRNSVLKAANNLQGILLFGDSSVSATGSYNEDTGKYGVESEVKVPVIDQVTLSGAINQDLSGSASLTLNPLAHSADRAQSKLTYRTAVISAEEARLAAENDAVKAALDWMIAKRELEAQKRTADLSRTTYEDDKVRYQKGETTFDDLQDSLIQWSRDRVTLTTDDKNYKDAESTLYSALGAGQNDVSVAELTVDELSSAVDSLIGKLNPGQGDVKKSSQYKEAVLNSMSSAASLKNTWSYEPDLKAGATVDFDTGGISNVIASLTFTFSPDDIQTSEKKASKEDYAIAAAKEQQSRNDAQLKLNQLLDTIDSSAINRNIAKIERDQAAILLSEAELLHKRGDKSEIELEQTRVSLQTSENALFKALAEQYEAWSSLREYL